MNQSNDTPIASNIQQNSPNIGVAQGIADLDFSLLDPGLLTGIGKMAKDGQAEPKGLEGHLVAHEGIDIGALIRQQPNQQVMASPCEVRQTKAKRQSGNADRQILERRRAGLQSRESRVKLGRHARWSMLVACISLLVSVSGCAAAGLLGLGGHSWKEEVLLHDGSKVIITRYQTYGGRHEIGQPSPIKEHTVTFTLPHTNKTVSWTSEYGEELGRTNFHLLAVHVLNGTPYIVTEPNLCLSYNKWGRPNPPYVFFKYDGNVWRRIPLEDLPTEFTTMNVVLGLSRQFVDAMVKQRVVPVEQIQKQNSQLPQPEYKTILRGQMKEVYCPEYKSFRSPFPIPSPATGDAKN